MKTKKTLRRLVIVAGLIGCGVVSDGVFDFGFLASRAEAIVGRPLTPVSYAGVARRTTRRMIYRTSVYVAALPATTCKTVIIEGVTLHQCGSTYYQPYGTQYVVVNVQ